MKALPNPPTKYTSNLYVDLPVSYIRQLIMTTFFFKKIFSGFFWSLKVWHLMQSPYMVKGEWWDHNYNGHHQYHANLDGDSLKARLNYTQIV